jgi:thiamine pyrophosphokinase
MRVVYDAIGGAFGGREDMSVQIILALAVLRLKEARQLSARSKSSGAARNR